MSWEILTKFCETLRTLSANNDEICDFEEYSSRPELFAKNVLGSNWWHKQRYIAKALVENRRVAVKSANGVGKTYLAADLCIWYLMTHPYSLVITTAPTLRQVRNLLWEEIGKRIRNARVPLPGRSSVMRHQITGGWYAIGISASDGVSFQGFHAENLMVVFDEASGIADDIWDAAEGIAVGANNKILAIGNPLSANGKFYKIFRDRKIWKLITVSALEHPNITGKGNLIPGAVTRESVEDRVIEWCKPFEKHVGGEIPKSDHLNWNGAIYVPNDLFRARVMGEFPTSSDGSLFDLQSIDSAFLRELPVEGVCRMAVDVARFGTDSTVIGVRIGGVVVRMETIQGSNTIEVSNRVAEIALEYSPEYIFIDSVGVGSGVVDQALMMGLHGVVGINVAVAARNKERFRNRRAELYWSLRQRFEEGNISLPEDDIVRQELMSIRYSYTLSGQVMIENKRDSKSRGVPSPDHADMLAMLFDDSWEDIEKFVERSSPNHRNETRLLRNQMQNW